MPLGPVCVLVPFQRRSVQACVSRRDVLHQSFEGYKAEVQELICAADRLGSLMQYETPGFLPNKRIHRGILGLSGNSGQEQGLQAGLASLRNCWTQLSTWPEWKCVAWFREVWREDAPSSWALAVMQMQSQALMPSLRGGRRARAAVLPTGGRTDWALAGSSVGWQPLTLM